MTTPRPIAEMIADKFIRHQVNLLRLDAGERLVIQKMLNQLRDDLLAKIATSSIDDKSLLQERRILALSKTVAATIQSQYANVAATHHDRLLQIAETVADQTLALTNAPIGVPLLTVGAPIEILRALADDTIVQGAPATAWWSRQATDLQTRFQNTIRQGVYAGDTLGDLLRRVRGTRELNFQDGLMAKSTRAASALIRTSVLSIANAARYETLRANDDVLSGQQWITTLDPRSCVVCAALSLQSWDFDGNPIGDTTEDFPGPPPRHFSCRCTLVPLLKSWEDLAKDANGNEKLGRKLDRVESKIDKGTQASMGRPISADVDYETWLNGRSKPEQQDILGPAKYALWSKGKLGLTDMVDQSGRPLTLKELQASVA